jgi:hypothetical protein
MGFKKVEFEFPEEEEDEGVEIKIEESSAQEMSKPEVEAAPEIEVVDEEPVDDDSTEEVTEEELSAYSKQVQKRIKKLSKGFHDERRSKEQAERESQEASSFAKNLVDENKKLKADLGRNQEILLDQAKQTSAADIEAAKKAYKAAHEDGDSDKLLEAQEKLTAANIKADKLKNFKIPALQEEDSSVKVNGENTPQPVKADPKADAWQQENPWFNENVEMTGAALGLHNKLVNDGVETNSDSYYERINTRMREMFPDQFDEEPEAKTRRTRSKNVVAPNTRSTMPKKIRLTRTQITLAKRLGLTPAEYAKQVAIDMRKE